MVCKIEAILLDGRAISSFADVAVRSAFVDGVRGSESAICRSVSRIVTISQSRRGNACPPSPPSLSIPPLGDTDRSLAAVKGISLESHASHLAARFMSPTVRDARFGRWCTKPPLTIGFHSSLCIIPGIHCLSSDLSFSSLSPQFHCIAA